MVRCFAAVDIGAGARAALSKALDELRAEGADLKPVEPRNLHVTLAFLGELPESVAQQKMAALRQLSFASFELELCGVGFFPDRSHARTLWAGCGMGTEQLASLQARVSQLLEAREERPFSPHVALSRVRSPRAIIALQVFADKHAGEVWGRFAVREVAFKKSTLTPQGPIYGNMAVVAARDTADTAP